MNTINDNLKEYKETPIGQIPIDWEIVPLHKIAKVIDGDRSSNYPSRDDFVEDGILFLSTKNIKGAFFDFTEKKFITQQKFNSINKGKLIKDDLVITMRGSIGNVARFLGDKYKTALINAQMSIIRPTSIGSEYLWTALNSFIIPRYLKKITTGSAQPQLTKKDVEKIPVIIPPLNEQRRIVTILSAWDKAIELKEKLIEQKKEQKKGLMQKLLTGEKRLPGYEGDWKEVKLGDLVERVIDNRGKTPPTTNFGYELIEVNAFEGNGRNPDYSKIKKYVDVKTFNSWFRNGHPIKNDILVATVGSVGATVIMEENRGCIAQNIIALRIKKDYSPEFIYYWMNSGSYFRLVKKVLMGAVQPSLKVPHLLQFKLKLPSLKEQYEIAKIFILIDDYIKLLENEVNQLNLQKKGLMQQLLTGKVRVKV